MRVGENCGDSKIRLDLGGFIALLPFFEDAKPHERNTEHCVIDSCRTNRHGATILLVSSLPDFPMTGQWLNTPISRQYELLISMASVDGAILIDRNGYLRGYGFILDGQANPEIERLSRGSRFNSALRFSQRMPNDSIIVVSEDGPLTVFRNGVIVYADPLSETDPFSIPTTDGESEMPLDVWGLLPKTRENPFGEATVLTAEG